MHLRCHVGFGSDVFSAETSVILTLNIASEAKISDLDIKILIQQNVFYFKITMCNIFRVHVVDRGDDLLGIVSDDLDWETALVGHEAEEVALRGKLARDVGYLS